jgi:hypothetical protein
MQKTDFKWLSFNFGCLAHRHSALARVIVKKIYTKCIIYFTNTIFERVDLLFKTTGALLGF